MIKTTAADKTYDRKSLGNVTQIKIASQYINSIYFGSEKYLNNIK